MSLKKELSKKEKISEALNKANTIFEYESSVYELLSLIDKESSFFDEAMNELRALFESASEKLDELQEMDIESLLDRIEKLSSLIRRYGSIEESLKYKEKKEKELAHYENIAFEKEQKIKHVPIIALTANTVAGDEEKYLQHGVDGYLAKPLKEKELSAVLKKFFKVKK